MNNCKATLPILFLYPLLGGCGLVLPPPMNPVTYADREVEAIVDPQKQIIPNESMVFYDSIFKSEGIRFPGGTYTLEAENTHY